MNDAVNEEDNKAVKEKKEKKKDGLVRRLYRRIRKAMTCCVKRQDDS